MIYLKIAFVLLVLWHGLNSIAKVYGHEFDIDDMSNLPAKYQKTAHAIARYSTIAMAAAFYGILIYLIIN